MFKKKTLEELKKELVVEKEKAMIRKQRTETEEEILQWKNYGKKKGSMEVPERMKKIGNFLKDEITFYGTNVRDNLDKDYGKEESSKGKKKKKKQDKARDPWEMI